MPDLYDEIVLFEKAIAMFDAACGELDNAEMAVYRIKEQQ